ncbi:hypothetical protein CLOM_g6340 [Closterium sp. NIES-68]|nr:hypothetical protein CLOM_g6340 [Closterium sp. NIES-68]
MLEETAFPNGILPATYDASSLYPSLPLRRGLDAVSDILQRGRHLRFQPVMAVLEWVMVNSYVECHGLLYHQAQGTAMGTPAALCFAVLFMSRLADLLTNKWSRTKPLSATYAPSTMV